MMMPRWVGWLAWGCALGGVGVVAASGGLVAGQRMAERGVRPTRAYTVSAEPVKDREIARLQRRLRDAQGSLVALMAAVRRLDDARARRAARDESLRRLARGPIERIAASLGNLMWLPGACVIHERERGWIVEGVLLSGQGHEDPAQGFFWSVEIDRSSRDRETPLRATRAVFDLRVYEPDRQGGGWKGVRNLDIDRASPFPKLDYGP